jgi:hypothetical protein
MQSVRGAIARCFALIDGLTVASVDTSRPQPTK